MPGEGSPPAHNPASRASIMLKSVYRALARAATISVRTRIDAGNSPAAAGCQGRCVAATGSRAAERRPAPLRPRGGDATSAPSRPSPPIS